MKQFKRRKVAIQDSQGLLFVFECIALMIKSIHKEKADWKYYIIVVLYLGHILSEFKFAIPRDERGTSGKLS